LQELHEICNLGTIGNKDELIFEVIVMSRPNMVKNNWFKNTPFGAWYRLCQVRLGARALPGGDKNVGCNLQGKVVSALPCRARVKFLCGIFGGWRRFGAFEWLMQQF